MVKSKTLEVRRDYGRTPGNWGMGLKVSAISEALFVSLSLTIHTLLIGKERLKFPGKSFGILVIGGLIGVFCMNLISKAN